MAAAFMASSFPTLVLDSVPTQAIESRVFFPVACQQDCWLAPV